MLQLKSDKLLATSIGALGAALIALFTLKELFEQRKSSYKPELCILNSQFEIKRQKFSNLELPLDWSQKSNKELDSIQWPHAKLVNIGFGAAKNINSKWEFDASTLITNINNLAQKSHQRFYLEYDENFVWIKFNGKSVYSVNSKMKEFDLEYILPQNQDSEGRLLNFPPSYTFLVGIYLYLCSKNKISLKDINTPDLQLSLSFQDIGNIRHKAKDKLVCKILLMTNYSSENDQCPEFTIQMIQGS